MVGGSNGSGGASLQLTTPPPPRVMMKPSRPARIEINVRARPAWKSEVKVLDVVCLLHCIWPVAWRTQCSHKPSHTWGRGRARFKRKDRMCVGWLSINPNFNLKLFYLLFFLSVKGRKQCQWPSFSFMQSLRRFSWWSDTKMSDKLSNLTLNPWNEMCLWVSTYRLCSHNICSDKRCLAPHWQPTCHTH